MCGCVFLEVAPLLKKADNGTNNYDWSNKFVFPLTQKDLDSLIFDLQTQDAVFTISNKTEKFELTSYGNYSLIKDEKEVLTDTLIFASVKSLIFMLQQAKIKTYGWN